MKPTRTYIADHALKLFNTHGFVNVRLQHIADAAFVSVGHLAYHFKNKDAIIDNLYERHRLQYENLLQEYRVMPLFIDFNQMLSELFALQTNYSFLYTDTLEILRAYPLMGEKYRAYSKWQLMQFEIMLSFHNSRGAISQPPWQIPLQKVAGILQVQLETWLYRWKITHHENPPLVEFLSSIWAVLIPFCTSNGKAELEDFYSRESEE
jgi:AcrR family transcriptional regulator